MSYFSTLFAKTNYNFKGKILPIIDFLTTFSIKREIRESPQYYSLYKWVDGDRIDKIANTTYGDPYDFWAIAKSNNFIDALSDIPKTTAQLNGWSTTMYPGSAWFVGPVQYLSENSNPVYSPGIDANERPAFVHGQDVVFGDFNADPKDTFIVTANSAPAPANTTKISIGTSDNYPVLPQQNKPEADGVPWYIPGFLPNVNAVILYKDPMVAGADLTANFESILAGDNLNLPGYHAAKVVQIDKKLKLFWLQSLDGHTVPSGFELFNFVKDNTDYCLPIKLMSLANVYHQDQTLGRLLVTFATNTQPLKVKKTASGTITGIPAIVVADLNRNDPINKDGLLNIRKFFVYKVVATATEALDTFGDATTNRLVGTSASPQKGISVRADTLSYLCRYVTGFYGGLPNNITVISIYNSLLIANRKNSLIKLPSPTVVTELRKSLKND